MPGCLFSRTFAKPRNTKVYRVFHCPTWEESAMIKITHSDAKGKRRTTVVNVISQTTKVLDNINVTLEFVTTPTIPLLSSIFLQAVNNDSNSEVALIGNDDVFALRCPTEKSTSNVTECVMEDTCSCSPTETDANCQCRNLNITERSNSVDSRRALLLSSPLQLLFFKTFFSSRTHRSHDTFKFRRVHFPGNQIFEISIICGASMDHTDSIDSIQSATPAPYRDSEDIRIDRHRTCETADLSFSAAH
ncbi:hypothetical protein Y032_1250g3785 [Ancylostoma ceylanicum]|uniref:Phlebovirus glycoprotein G2 fusion domain-containing protein n=1 Tax=Ancylostoma ceylanicum TaxID=53326 RepID=A0A016W7F6_9BILA|nr:hypothetical protein Y032_1250g3785 [Ancylostoma ceylanicum]